MTMSREVEKAAKEEFLNRLRERHRVTKVRRYRNIWLANDEFCFLLLYSKEHDVTWPYFFGVTATNLIPLVSLGREGYVVFICGKPNQFLCVPVKEVLSDALAHVERARDGQWKVHVADKAGRRWEIKLAWQRPVDVSEYFRSLPAGFADVEH